MRVLLPGMIAFITAAVGLAQELPGELAHLTELAAKEAELIDAVRRFDLQQQALLEWDQALIEEYEKAGEHELVETKIADARRRIRLIGEGWDYALSHYPNNPKALVYYGEYLYDRLGRQADALRYWKEALAIDDEMSDAHNNLSIHYFHVGDYDLGLRHLGKALDLEPENPDFLFNAAQMYLVHFPQIARRYDKDKKELYKEAMRLSKKAAKFAPNDYEILEDYAVNFWAAENFGVEADWQEAANAWKAARRVARTEDEVFYTHLNEGRAWLEGEYFERAAEQFKQAIALRPDSQPAKRLLERATAQTSKPD